MCICGKVFASMSLHASHSAKPSNLRLISPSALFAGLSSHLPLHLVSFNAS